MDAYTAFYKKGFEAWVDSETKEFTPLTELFGWRNIVRYQDAAQWYKEGWEAAQREEQKHGRAKFLAMEFQKFVAWHDEYEGIGKEDAEKYIKLILKALE